MKPILKSLILCTCVIVAAPLVASAADKTSGHKLYEAALFMDLEQMKQLIAGGADVNYMENGRPILGWAAQNGSVEVVKLLLDSGAKPNLADEGIGHTALHRAIDTQQIEVVRTLLAAKADPNVTTKDGRTPIGMAVSSGKLELVQSLIDAKANVRVVSPDGDSPVLTAAQNSIGDSAEIIKLLAKAGADMDVSNPAYTPLSYAIEQGNKDLVKTLLDAGAKPDAKTSSDRIPIFIALDNKDILEQLIAAKADLNATDSYGDTPLHSAVANGQVDAVRALVKAGADTSKTDASGNTPRARAEQNYRTEVVAVFDELNPPKPSAKSNTKCDIATAAKMQMEVHGMLQAKVNEGKMKDDIFRTFNNDTKDYGRMLTEDPSEACALFERLKVKYGLQ